MIRDRQARARTVARKEEHLRIALSEDVAFKGLTTGLEKLLLRAPGAPRARPARRSTSRRRSWAARCGRRCVISPMVGGVEEAARINQQPGDRRRRRRESP